MADADRAARAAPGMTIEIAGEPLRLLGGRAVAWPARRTLLIADPHFGKAGVFRRQGIPVPAGTTADDLHRVTRLVRATDAERLVVLGDFFHARPHPAEPWLAAVAAWRREMRQLAVTVVAGNHDAHAGGPEPGWSMEWIDGARHCPPFVFAHEPQPDPRGYVLAGHLHPVMTMRDAGDRLRVPVFWFREHTGVLPAFGAFTGGAPVAPAPGDRVFAAGEDAVVPCGRG